MIISLVLRSIGDDHPIMLSGDDWWELLLHLLMEEPPTIEGEREAALRFAEIHKALESQWEHEPDT
jgi:hypothetical protein